MLYLDYGTIYDSRGEHVDLWCATIIHHDSQYVSHRHHVVIFYEKEPVHGEGNKNANTGMMALRELVIFLHVMMTYLSL